jgi:hypothetical protein
MENSDPEGGRYSGLEGQPLWFKVVEMLQQNWAVISADKGPPTLIFIDDGGFIFDELTFDSANAATSALRRNGFSKYSVDHEAQEFIAPPRQPYQVSEMRKRPIYSSGQFWR